MDAIQFLTDGNENEAADLLRSCTFENWEIVDSWMDGNRQLDGLLIEVACPRSAYEIITNHSHGLTKSIKNSLAAVLPSGTYLKSLRARAIPSKSLIRHKMSGHLPEPELLKLIQTLEAQKGLMISVATGGPRINDVNVEYVERRFQIKRSLQSIGIEDPNPYSDLWAWYGKWSDGSLPSYQSRRRYIIDLYRPLLEALSQSKAAIIHPVEPTGWARVDRNIEKISRSLELAKNEEDFQAIALLCREAIISLAQAVYDPREHGSVDGMNPSETDA